MTSEPRWLRFEELIPLHDYVLERTGGASGVRDDGLIHSALQRPINRYVYEGVQDIPKLAAAYGFGIAKNHGFVDGNKRAAFLAIGVFLELNGFTLKAEMDDATATIQRLAAGQLDEDALAAWIRDNSAAT